MIYPGKNNSKKISELKPRDIITVHKDHSWIPVAQYDSRIDSYTNLAINIAALTDYSDSYSYAAAYNVSTEFASYYDLDGWMKFQTIGDSYNYGYITPELDELVNNSDIAQNLATYIFSYTDIMHDWKYLFGYYEMDVIPNPEYLYTDLEQYILTEDGRKIIIDNG